VSRLNISLDNGESENMRVEEERPPQQESPLPPLVISRERKPQAPLMVAVPEQQSAAVQAASRAAPAETAPAVGVTEAAPAEGTAEATFAGAAAEAASGAEFAEASEATFAGATESSPLASVVAQPPQVLWISPAEPIVGAGAVPLSNAASQVTGAGGNNTKSDGIAEAPMNESAQAKPRKEKRKRRAKGGAKRRRGRTQRLFLVALRDMLIALALLVLLLQFFSPTVVREHSMEDTLKENEILYIARRAYWFGEPQHGDIVVFHITLSGDSGDGKTLVKRIIGVPGDHITISGGVVYRNDRPLDEAYVKGGMTLGDLNDLEVPDDSYFVLGDNREVSNDSRNADIGFVEKSQLRGKVMFRIFPLSEFHVF
jgi:signal peptidase I